MDSSRYDFIAKLLQNQISGASSLSTQLYQGVRALIQPDTAIQEVIEIAAIINNQLEDVLASDDPVYSFQKQQRDVNSCLKEFLGEFGEVDLDLYELFILAEREYKNRNPPKSMENLVRAEMKVQQPNRQRVNDDNLFSSIYMQAYVNNPGILEDPKMAVYVLDIIRSDKSDDTIQNELLELLGIENVECLMELIQNRKSIKNSLARAETNYNKLVYQPSNTVTVIRDSDRRTKRENKRSRKKQTAQTTNLEILGYLGFDSEFLKENNKLGLKSQSMSNQQQFQLDYSGSAFNKRTIPIDVKYIQKDYYQEYILPPRPPKQVQQDTLIPVSALEEWAQPAFEGVEYFNSMQSICFDSTYFQTYNLLVSAPTGAGKTNVALLCILNVLRSCMDESGVFTGQFKVIYVSPMKALAAEVTDKFSKKLAYLGISVRELTGDMQLSRSEVMRTHVIVTTPEKWDVITRKTESIAHLVKLLILDEIHLLDDERGPVLECLVARTLRQVESTQSTIRIVGLSATLPNYQDVAQFLKAPAEGTYYFDGSYRPVPLEQRFIGVEVVANQVKQYNMIMEATYEKVVEQLRQDQQVMIFVHSRNECQKTAETLRQMAIQRHELVEFECCYMSHWQKEVQKSRNLVVKQLFEAGFGIHNAGMLRKDRSLTEELFRQKQIKVLISTATLAWGVNLPAHAVIIKGTEIYDSSLGGFKDVGVLDVQQIFGRAGRPDYDTSGLAIIITTTAKVDKYLAMLAHQNPIESQLLSILPDALNAEIALGTVHDLEEAMRWLQYTYLYVRVGQNPLAYGLHIDDAKDRSSLIHYLKNQIAAELIKLKNMKLIRFEASNKQSNTTALGRIASNFYIKHTSMDTYLTQLKPSLTENQILRIFSESSEFEQLKMREEEIQELQGMREVTNKITGLKLDQDDMHNTYGKVVVLLYCYLARHPTYAFSLVADQAYIIQNGIRILRALFEISITNMWSELSEQFLELSRCIERRLVPYRESPLKQFTKECGTGGYTISTNNDQFKGGFLSSEYVQKVEKNNKSIDQIKEMEFKELSYLIRVDAGAREILKFSNYIPCLDLNVTVQPITGNIVKIHIEISPQFQWNDRWHNQVLGYWFWVDDCSTILHVEHYTYHKRSSQRAEKPSLTFAVPVHKSSGSIYALRCFSDNWVGASTNIELNIQDLHLPEDDIIYTKLLDLNPLPKTALFNPEYESLIRFDYFNPIQTQAFHTLYHHDTNVLMGAPTGSGKTVTAEIAMFRQFNEDPSKKVIYIAPLKALAKERLKDWQIRLQAINKSVVELTGDYTPDIRSLMQASVVITTPEKWDGISRNWQHRSYVKDVGLLIIDEIHLLGQDRGPVLEVIVSRMRFISNSLKTKCRIIGLSTALANSQDVANWLGIEKIGFFNFHPSVRPVVLQTHIDGFPEKAYCPRMATMNKPTYNAIKAYSPEKPSIVFVSSRRQTRITAFDLIAYCANDADYSLGFSKLTLEESYYYLEQIKDTNLKHTLQFGIGIHHAGLPESDRNIVETLFVSEKILVLVTTSTLAWGVNFPAHLVVIKGTEFYDAKEKRYVDFPMTDILQMMGRAGRPQYDDEGYVQIFAQTEKVAFLKVFLFQPFPVESSLAGQLFDHINAEIASGTLTSRGSCVNYITWTYFFRRLTRNPAFYNLENNQAETVNNYLTSLIDNVLNQLIQSDCIIEEEDGYLMPTVLGSIASFYYVTHKTVHLLAESLQQTEKSFEEIVKILSQVPEFQELPVRHNEDQLNEELAKLVPYKVDMRALDSPHTKAHLLLQAHLSRVTLPISDYITDLKTVIDSSVRIVHSMVDVCAHSGTLSSTLKIMTLLQMLAQGQWYYDSSLKNLPGMTDRAIRQLIQSEYAIDCLAQLAELHPKQLDAVLATLPEYEKQGIRDQAFKCIRRVPIMKIEWEVLKVSTMGASDEEKEETLWEDSDEEFPPGDIVNVKVTLEKINHNVSYRPVFQKTTRQQELGFWICIGCENTDKVLGLKRVSSIRRLKGVFDMTVCVPEEPNLMIYLICDSYLGLDQQYKLG